MKLDWLVDDDHFEQRTYRLEAEYYHMRLYHKVNLNQSLSFTWLMTMSGPEETSFLRWMRKQTMHCQKIWLELAETASCNRTIALAIKDMLAERLVRTGGSHDQSWKDFGGTQ